MAVLASIENTNLGEIYVPKIKAPLMPIYLTRMLEKKQENTIKQKVNALAPFTKYGFSSPPAPREFMAPHMPGAAKLQRSRIVAL
jgi:hypothetical protein